MKIYLPVDVFMVFSETHIVVTIIINNNNMKTRGPDYSIPASEVHIVYLPVKAVKRK